MQHYLPNQQHRRNQRNYGKNTPFVKIHLLQAKYFFFSFLWALFGAFDLLDPPKGRTGPATPQILYLLLPTGREVNESENGDCTVINTHPEI